jgi:hypothetical protein
MFVVAACFQGVRWPNKNKIARWEDREPATRFLTMNLINGPVSAFFAVSAALMTSGFAYAKLYLKK